MRGKMRAGTTVVWLIAGVAAAQTPPPGPTFEVASVKAAEAITSAAIQSGKMHLGMTVDGARVDIGGLPLTAMLVQAFGVKPYQVSGPDWMPAERFDIVAKLPEGATQDQIPAMLQALLAERFKLAFHRENREQSVYVLVVAKGGPKLKEAAAEADPAPAAEPPKSGISIGTVGPGGGPVRISQEARGRGAIISGPQFGTMKIGMGQDGAMHLEASKMTLAALTDLLGSFVDRPVVDQTELKGAYQVVLDLSMEDIIAVARARGMANGISVPIGGPVPIAAPGATSSVATASDPSGGAIFAAVQKLGLKLEPRKAPVETIVVDHLEKTPTEN